MLRTQIRNLGLSGREDEGEGTEQKIVTTKDRVSAYRRIDVSACGCIGERGTRRNVALTPRRSKAGRFAYNPRVSPIRPHCPLVAPLRCVLRASVVNSLLCALSFPL
jgi:hypothetical protein